MRPSSVLHLHCSVLPYADSSVLLSVIGPRLSTSPGDIERAFLDFTCRAAPVLLHPSSASSPDGSYDALYILRSAPLPDSRKALQVLRASPLRRLRVSLKKWSVLRAAIRSSPFPVGRLPIVTWNMSRLRRRSKWILSLRMKTVLGVLSEGT